MAIFEKMAFSGPDLKIFFRSGPKILKNDIFENFKIPEGGTLLIFYVFVKIRGEYPLWDQKIGPFLKTRRGSRPEGVLDPLIVFL